MSNVTDTRRGALAGAIASWVIISNASLRNHSAQRKHRSQFHPEWRTIHGNEPELPPPYSRDWAEARDRETLAKAAGRHMTLVEVADTQPGDLLLFALNDYSPAKHCVILVAADRMVRGIESHAVAEVSLGSWWRRRIRFIAVLKVCVLAPDGDVVRHLRPTGAGQAHEGWGGCVG
ncbi:peptidase P60 [Aurantimonas sp. A3-2-R12]|nr:peptidase P60 [Aurantimonas sp. A3-2-R12]